MKLRIMCVHDDNCYVELHKSKMVQAVFFFFYILKSTVVGTHHKRFGYYFINNYYYYFFFIFLQSLGKMSNLASSQLQLFCCHIRIICARKSSVLYTRVQCKDSELRMKDEFSQREGSLHLWCCLGDVLNIITCCGHRFATLVTVCVCVCVNVQETVSKREILSSLNQENVWTKYLFFTKQ